MKYLNLFESFIAANANLSKNKSRKLLQAKEMERREVSEDTIRIATGWFKNPNDGEWRFENDSAAIKLNSFMWGSDKYEVVDYEDCIVKLPDLLKNTSLFMEYPDLKQVTVRFHAKGFKGNGSYEESKQLIRVYGVNMTFNKIRLLEKDLEAYLYYDTQEYRDMFPITNRQGRVIDYEEAYAPIAAKRKEWQSTLEQFKSYYVIKMDSSYRDIILHEIQHAIQYIEDLPLGGSASQFRPYDVEDEDGVLIKHVSSYQQYRNVSGEIEAFEVGDRHSLPKKTEYIVYHKPDGTEYGFVASFPTEAEAKDFIRHNPTAKTRGYQTVSADDLEIEAVLSRKDKKPFASLETPKADIKFQYKSDEPK